VHKEEIIHNGRRFALIWRKEPPRERIHFFTEDESALQVGKHWRRKNEKIQPHRHVPVKVERTDVLQEVLYIEKGKVKVSFYSDENKEIDQKIISEGDLILLVDGGHSFEFLEETEMIEVKQGPYDPSNTQKFEGK